MPPESCEINRSAVVSGLHLPQKGPLLQEDELVLLREGKIREAFGIGLQPGTIGLIVRKTWKRDQAEGDVVGPLMRHPVAKQIAAAFGNDGEPSLCVLLEQVTLERVELIADENGDGHEALLVLTRL